MDLLDCSGFWDWTSDSVIPPIPPVEPSSGGSGDFPTRVRWSEEYLRAQALRKQRLREDEEIILFLK